MADGLKPSLRDMLLQFVRSLDVGRVYTAQQIHRQAALQNVADLDYFTVMKSVRTGGLNHLYPGSCILDISLVKDLETRENWRCWQMAHVDTSSDDDEQSYK
jgi:hypothetical protein